MQPHQANTELTRALAAAGLPHIRVHDLRHTTAAVHAGRPAFTLRSSKNCLATRRIATTLDTYSHVLPVLHGQAVRLLDEWLGEPRPT